MSSHNRHSNRFSKLDPVINNKQAFASHDPFEDNSEEAQERRREERRKRKQQTRRREQMLPEEEGDPDLLLEEPKKQKRKKKKKARPELWYDDILDNEDLFDEALEFEDGLKERHKDDDDRSDEWDS